MSSNFQATRWSMIQNAAAMEKRVRERAWEEFDHLYRRPLLAFIRRCGWPESRAEDLLQSFLAVAAEKNWLAEADPERGKMRTFLLGRLKRHLNDVRKHDQAQKRGGGAPAIDLDEVAAVLEDPVASREAECEFDKAWAQSILDHTLGSMEEKANARGRGEVFQSLRGLLLGDSDEKLTTAAARLNQSEGAIRMQLQRMREDFRKRLRAEVAETLMPEEDVSTEMRYLARVLSE